MNSKIKLLTTGLSLIFGIFFTVLSPIIISNLQAYTTGCVEYKPLQRGPSREDMSLVIRGPCKGVTTANNPRFSLSVIAPEKAGKTYIAQLPPLYWWVSHPVNASFRFTWVKMASDDESIENTYKEIILPLFVKAGIQKFPLDKLFDTTLLANAQYNWSVRLLCEPPNFVGKDQLPKFVGEDRFSSGMIIYEKPSKEIFASIKEEAHKWKLPCTCIENDFWYNAFHKVQQRLQNKPNDKEFRDLRSELLEKENLDKVLFP